MNAHAFEYTQDLASSPGHSQFARRNTGSGLGIEKLRVAWGQGMDNIAGGTGMETGRVGRRLRAFNPCPAFFNPYATHSHNWQALSTKTEKMAGV